MGTKWKWRIRIGLASIGRRATCGGMNPNWEYNERNTAVVFGALGERKEEQ
jgi:hypothetical protein